MSPIENAILSKTEKTFQYDKDLLTLPVPDLAETLQNYLESVKPLVSEEEYQQTEFLCQQFASGAGKYLQSCLSQKANGQRNWLEKWWEDAAYLDFRMPLPLISMGGPGPYTEDVWPAEEGTQLCRGSLSAYYFLKFWQFICREQYQPMKNGKGRPMCMYQFRRIFNGCRIPGVYRDKLESHFKTDSEGGCPSHMIVTCKGHMFMMNCLDESGEVITPMEIEMQFLKIRDNAERLGAAQEVNYLTTLPRTAWAQYRNQLLAHHPNNYKVLEKIQSAITFYCLEEEEPEDMSDVANKCMLGDMQNRWCDKSISMSVYKNGTLSCNADHSFTEGIMLVYVTSYIHKKIIESKGVWQGTKFVRPQPEPKLLKFVLSEEIQRSIKLAKVMYLELQKAATCVIFKYEGYGKSYCKAMKVHPDAYCQLAIQLTYFSLHGRMAPTYETAPLKQFYHGRTETLRSCTMEAYEWCKSMKDPMCSEYERYELFQKAVAKHNAKMADACELKGCDRHLLALSLIAREQNIQLPALYQDQAFTKSGGNGNFLLSTSNIGYTSIMGGVLPMCKNSYGCFYRINDNNFTFFISTWNADDETSSQEFADCVGRTLDCMRSMVNQCVTVQAKM